MFTHAYIRFMRILFISFCCENRVTLDLVILVKLCVNLDASDSYVLLMNSAIWLLSLRNGCKYLFALIGCYSVSLCALVNLIAIISPEMCSWLFQSE